MSLLIHKKPDNSENKLEFTGKPLVIGRVAESDITVKDSFVSRVHCGVSIANNQFTLKDLGSTNGTYRNGARVFECVLHTGDKIQVGNTTLIFEVDQASGNGVLREVPQMATAARLSITQNLPQPPSPNPAAPLPPPAPPLPTPKK
jgi:pSer/pThr/pTyr-binding forkhead associated (FHA) protein